MIHEKLQFLTKKKKKKINKMLINYNIWHRCVWKLRTPCMIHKLHGNTQTSINCEICVFIIWSNNCKWLASRCKAWIRFQGKYDIRNFETLVENKKERHKNTVEWFKYIIYNLKASNVITKKNVISGEVTHIISIIIKRIRVAPLETQVLAMKQCENE